MILVGIDVGKNKHSYCIYKNDSGELLKDPDFFNNNSDGFKTLIESIKPYDNDSTQPLTFQLTSGQHFQNRLCFHLHLSILKTDIRFLLEEEAFHMYSTQQS